MSFLAAVSFAHSNKWIVASIANATADLVMIAAWSSALQFINGEAIPVCTLGSACLDPCAHIQNRHTTSPEMIASTGLLWNASSDIGTKSRS